jgi:hypothetical protein
MVNSVSEESHCEHQVPPLEAIQEKELEALMAAAESELVKR